MIKPYLPPFKRWTLQNFPFIEDDFDSITNYQLYCKIVEYIKSVDVYMQGVDSFLTEVENYFNNLDVQEEINNKLDQMAEDGTLEEIMASYLNTKAIFCFDTVNDLKSATNLIDGSYAKTLGYHTINDGGSSTYKIRTITNDDIVDESFIIALNDNTLIAELIYNEIDLMKCGCYGNGTNDDTNTIKKCINKALDKKVSITSPSGKSYLISEAINLYNLNVNLNYSEIKSNTNIDTLLLIQTIEDNTNYSDYYGEIQNIKINCSNVDRGLWIKMGRKKHIHNLIFENINLYGLNYSNGYEVLVENCHFKGNGQTGTRALYNTGGDSNFNNLIIIDCENAITNAGLNFYNNIHAWILTHALCETSKMFIITGNSPCYLSQIYSDTYGTTFQMGGGWFIANQLHVYFNPGIYEASFQKPYLIYGVEQFTSYYGIKCSLTDSDIRGVRADQQIRFSNNIKNIKCNNVNYTRVIDFYSGVVDLIIASSQGIDQITQNRIYIKNGFCHINLDFRLDTEVTKSFTFNQLPTACTPNGEILGTCGWGDNNYNTNDGIGFFKIAGRNFSGNIKGTVTGRYAYVHINVMYPIYAVESMEY